MTIFQAYCSNIADPRIWRFVLTFPDSNVADEWWRAISDTPSIASLFTRVTTQFYTHDASSFNIMNFFTDPRTSQFAPDFKGKLFITLLNDQVGRELPIIPDSVLVANAISGNWFFLRSTADSNLYWYFDPTNKAHNLSVSATGRTAFCISAVDQATAGKVLVDTDLVTLQIEWQNLYVSVDKVQALFGGPDASQFLFGDLKYKIGYMPSYGFLTDKRDSPVNSGWQWELVE